MTSPPFDLESFHPCVLSGWEFLYFKFHGLPGLPYWYDLRWRKAISAEQIAGANLAGAVVFCACCHVSGQTPLLAALRAAGARAIVGGAGESWARVSSVGGVDLLGRWFRVLCSWGLGPGMAFRLARLRAEWAGADVEQFRLYLGQDAGRNDDR